MKRRFSDITTIDKGQQLDEAWRVPRILSLIETPEKSGASEVSLKPRPLEIGVPDERIHKLVSLNENMGYCVDIKHS